MAAGHADVPRMAVSGPPQTPPEVLSMPDSARKYVQAVACQQGA
jgi:hypothetical protein